MSAKNFGSQRFALSRGKALKPGKRRKVDTRASAKWCVDVVALHGDRCLVTGRAGEELHHVIPQQALRRRGLDAHLWDPRNGIPLTKHVHARHTSRLEPIPRSILPASAFEFAAELGLTHVLERAYPESHG